MRLSEYRMRRTEKQLAAVRARPFYEFAATLLVFFVVVVSGCGSPKPIKYYTLTPPATTLDSSHAPIDAVLLIRLFQAPHLYREDRIVYGNESNEMGVYENNRWAQTPIDLLQDALARRLRASGQFKVVTTLRSDAAIDYYLSGHLYAFREVTGNNILARLSYDVDLVDSRRGKSVWRRTYDHNEPVSGKALADVVAAMDRNVQRSAQEIQDGIVQAITGYHPQSQ